MSGLAFLPVTAVMFAAARIVPRLVPAVGTIRLLAGGVFVALVGMAWLSRLSADTPFFPSIVLPMALLGIGIGSALVPLTTAGIAGVQPKDAGAASGLVNVAQQLGGSLGLGILVTVFAAASRTAAHHPAGVGSIRTAAQHDLAYAVATVPHRVGHLPGPGLGGDPGGHADPRTGPRGRDASARVGGGGRVRRGVRHGVGLTGGQSFSSTMTSTYGSAPTLRAASTPPRATSTTAPGMTSASR